MQKKLTLLWQTPGSHLEDWIREIFAPVIDREVADGRHQLVLDDCLIVDSNVHIADPAYYGQFKGRNAFLLREPDEYFRDVSSEVYANFCGVIRMHHSYAFRQERVLNIPVGYNKGLGAQGATKRASQRRFAWSLLGQMNKSTRPDALRELLSIEPGYWYASDGWTPGSFTAASNAVRNQSVSNYRELMTESAFCPSPMGNVNLETTRPYGALEAGSIPLLERRWSIDVHRRLLGDHPLPTFSDWKAAASFVQSMWRDPKALDQLQNECVSWWSLHKERVSAQAVEFIDCLWQRQPMQISGFIRGYARIPGWPIFELLRHHSSAALRRRVIRQVRRVVEQGRLFERL
jgi:hypothetical protein